MAIAELESPYPLKGVTDSDLQKLTRVLWNWNICSGCQDGPATSCAEPKCSWRVGSTRLRCFFDFYRDVTSYYVPELLPGSRPALRNHDDVLDIIRLLKGNPAKMRSELTEEYFSERPNSNPPPPAADQHRAFNLAVKVMSMVTCSAENQPSDLLELGMQPIQWRADRSLTEFMTQAFPKADVGDLRVIDDAGRTKDVKHAITARKLRKVAGLKFEETDDLRSHLRLDTKTGVIQIFHYTSMLKEHLLTASTPATTNSGVIPRQIALEALDSVQKILFPLDTDSELILRGLVSKNAFDPDSLQYDSTAYRSSSGDEGGSENDITYTYFGSRLLDLYEELEDPTPRGLAEKWLQRKSGARYVMLATLAGVCIAIVLGMLGLAVGIFQAWVSYEAWKHPNGGSND
ncbi:hypothetical protein B0H63DRAFT_435786 [Podospora didyma]|uniref:Uncharacterized protein n=1 Tax=Podospora didyma TaxID=330526 RepID=A0AAE0NCH4_9PEZI|nr:hypothetical protein B0H63DRAFT_435786 [Podospora didyma]